MTITLEQRKLKNLILKWYPTVSILNQFLKKETKKEVLNLNPKESSSSGTIPVTILKQTIDVHLQHLANG